MTLSKSELSLIIALASADIENAKLCARIAALEEAARELVEYRRQAGAINFQLEKADEYIKQLSALLKGNPDV